VISVATIASIIRKGRGCAHAWRVEHNGIVPDGWETCELWHYSTRMLVWRIRRHQGSDYGYTELVDYSLGWGSVSDQNGMNIAFRVLNLPHRYNRAGGASIVDLVFSEELGYFVHPSAVAA